MKTERETTRIVRSWLEIGADRLPDRVLDSVLGQLPAYKQRRAPWWPPARRYAPMNVYAKAAIAAAAVLVVLIAGYNLLPGRGDTGGPPPSPSASALVLPLGEERLAAGTYTLGAGFPVGITFDVPENWTSSSGSVFERSVGDNVAPGVGVGFMIVDNVVADACGPADQLLDPPVGPSVDDLVSAISNLTPLVATAPENVTVDGFSGKQLTVTAPEDVEAGCDLQTWANQYRTNGVGAGEVNELRILDVDGVRILIAGVYFPATVTEEGRSALEQVIASIQIEP